MTKQEWLDQVKQHATVLRSLINEFHPGSASYDTGQYEPDLDMHVPRSLPITAPNAEAASVVVREAIRKETSPTITPIMRFDLALNAGDDGEIYTVLNQAWMGVPESTSCWRIPGFKEAVELLDDPPDPPEPSES